jgi:4-hydroxy-2-oxoheptanedioate aldolase
MSTRFVPSTVSVSETRPGASRSSLIWPDLVFIGPNDLAQAMLGYVPARGDEPEYVAAIDKIAAAAKKHGKWSGRLVNNGALAKEAKSTFDLVAITGDTKAIQNWYIGELEVARA